MGYSVFSAVWMMAQLVLHRLHSRNSTVEAATIAPESTAIASVATAKSTAIAPITAESTTVSSVAAAVTSVAELGGGEAAQSRQDHEGHEEGLAGHHVSAGIQKEGKDTIC